MNEAINEVTEQKAKEHPEHPDTGRDVTITVNTNPFEVHRGRQSVVYIKTQAGVPLADELALDLGTELKPLDDDGHWVLHGGEAFISYPREASSS